MSEVKSNKFSKMKGEIQREIDFIEDLKSFATSKVNFLSCIIIYGLHCQDSIQPFNG